MPASPSSPGPGLKEAVLRGDRFRDQIYRKPGRTGPALRHSGDGGLCEAEGGASAGPGLHRGHQPGNRGGRLARGQPGVCQEGVCAGTRRGNVQKRRPVGHGPLGHQSGRDSGSAPWSTSALSRLWAPPWLTSCPFSRRIRTPKAWPSSARSAAPTRRKRPTACGRKEYTKPLVIFVAGAWAPEGMRFSHASSIIERGKGSAKSKIRIAEGSRCTRGGSAR